MHTLLRALLLAIAVVVGMYGPASAWGRAGHRIVCTIAFRLAAPATQTEIRRLMRLDPEFPTFEDACSWPDHPRRRGSEHTVHVPRSATGLRSDCPLATGCVVRAVRKDMAVLSSKSANDVDRLAALKFLAHWVGDIHQPLHAAFKDDRVGNDIAVVGECSGTMHTIWDSCLVAKAVGSDAAKAASDIAGSLTSAARKAWSSSGPRDWATESFTVATHPGTKYCARRRGVCELPLGPVVADAAYVTHNAQVVRDRLARAGARLAHLLDSALGR